MAEEPAAAKLLRQSLDAIREAYQALGRDDFHGRLLEIVDPAIVIRDRPESPDPRTYHGHEGLDEALHSSDETFEDFELDPVDFVAEGDCVIVVLIMRGRGRGSGVTVEERIAHQWTVRDGKAVAMQVYSDPEEALRDARAAARRPIA